MVESSWVPVLMTPISRSRCGVAVTGLTLAEGLAAAREFVSRLPPNGERVSAAGTQYGFPFH
jgi:hypothetical protein